MRFVRTCLASAFFLLAWAAWTAAPAFIFTPPMLLTTTSTAVSIINLGVNQAAGGGTLSITVPAGGVPAGSTIVVLTEASAGPAQVVGLTDTAGNTYTAVAFINVSGVAANVWVKQNCAALVAGNTITFQVNIGQLVLSGLAIVGALPASLDQNVTNSGGAASPITVTSGTPTAANEVFVGGLAFIAIGPVATMTQMPGWTTPFTFSATGTLSEAVGGGYLINPTATAKTYAPTTTPAKPWGAFILSFKT